MPAGSLVYFSSVTNNTARFVERLGIDGIRLPLHTAEPAPLVTEPYVLVVPTYGAGNTRVGAVPRQVIKFLNEEQNRRLIRGVIGAGNTNFGEHYGEAADIIAAKCRVPVLYRFELMGTSDDVAAVTQGLEELWTRPSLR
ncbi:ribonucleotide reductase assembly protein NrdI [Tersicoccus phoenicis]|uniref:Protein NrdI n=1 Tax=Tersicoccus phoenicis TaxID=554083 RepID=A0A1R1LCB9_9MICC|nr:ribonucleotide reductase assembly protein NrdI [Tersicoccus phoenicis]